MISVFTDGASGAGGGKPGGWAWVIVRNEDEVLGTDLGGSTSTTNNVMELTAAIQGLQALKFLKKRGTIQDEEFCELVSDSQYVLGMASGGWAANTNKSLVDELKSLAAELKVRLRWVAGHNGDKWNERCDSLAGLAKQKQKDLVKTGED